MPKWDAHGSKVKGRQASPGGDRAGVFTEHVHKFGHSYHTEVRTVLWKSIKLDFSGFGATLVCPWGPPRHVCNVCAADRRVLLTYSLMPFRRGGGAVGGGGERAGGLVRGRVGGRVGGRACGQTGARVRGRPGRGGARGLAHRLPACAHAPARPRSRLAPRAARGSTGPPLAVSLSGRARPPCAHPRPRTLAPSPPRPLSPLPLLPRLCAPSLVYH